MWLCGGASSTDLVCRLFFPCDACGSHQKYDSENDMLSHRDIIPATLQLYNSFKVEYVTDIKTYKHQMKAVFFQCFSLPHSLNEVGPGVMVTYHDLNTDLY